MKTIQNREDVLHVESIKNMNVFLFEKSVKLRISVNELKLLIAEFIECDGEERYNFMYPYERAKFAYANWRKQIHELSALSNYSSARNRKVKTT